jgi:hypothetical protein
LVIASIGELERAVEQRDFSSYDNCQKIENWIKQGSKSIKYWSRKFTDNSKELVEPLVSRIDRLKLDITDAINNDDGTRLGEVSEYLAKLEGCMEYENWLDFYFMYDEACSAVDRLGDVKGVQAYFKVDKAKNRMHSRLQLYRNLIAKHHPEAKYLWEQVRHNLAMESAAEDMADAHHEIAYSLDDIADQLEESNQVSLLQAASTAAVGYELEKLKQVQFGGVAISAFQAWQQMKMRKAIT